MLHRWQPTKGFLHSVITWQRWCLLLQVISAKPRENDVQVLREVMLLLTHLKSKGSICGVVLHSEKYNWGSFTPSIQIRRQHEQNLHRRRFYWRWIWQWPTDEVTGEQGYVDDEGVWTWDNNKYDWQSRPFGSRKLKKRSKGKGKNKGWSRGTRRAFLGEEQAHESELWSEEDSAWWSKGKRGKKGLSKGNKSFRKGGFHTSPSEKGSSRDFFHTKARARIVKK